MIEKQTKNFVLYLTAVVSLVLIIFGGCYLSDIFARKHLKAQCGSGMDCVCFFNIVDNRLNINQVRVFTEFLDAVKIRPTANILEFTDEVNAREISAAVALCRLEVPQEQPKTYTKKYK